MTFDKERLQNSPRYKSERDSFLIQNRSCAQCRRNGVQTKAEVVVHQLPSENEEQFWDQANWRALCRPCQRKRPRNESRERAKWRVRVEGDI